MNEEKLDDEVINYQLGELEEYVMSQEENDSETCIGMEERNDLDLQMNLENHHLCVAVELFSMRQKDKSAEIGAYLDTLIMQRLQMLELEVGEK